MIGIFRTLSIGQIMAMPKILNIMCEKATARGAIVPETRLARSAVIVVPIFAPSV